MTEAISDTTAEAAEETRVVPIGGRDITVRRLNETQILQLNHEATLLQREDLAPQRLRKGMDRVFRALSSVVVDEDDSDFLQDLMADGDLDLRDMIKFITSFHVDQAPTTGPVKVRRGRPPTKRA
jgi:hypothetical protein